MIEWHLLKKCNYQENTVVSDFMEYSYFIAKGMSDKLEYIKEKPVPAIS